MDFKVASMLKIIYMSRGLAIRFLFTSCLSPLFNATNADATLQ